MNELSVVVTAWHKLVEFKADISLTMSQHLDFILYLYFCVASALEEITV